MTRRHDYLNLKLDDPTFTAPIGRSRPSSWLAARAGG
ncbi:DUF736 domain-containing protein [Methylobacterium nodulans]|nr:DUF736 domain-containing protein [Methylobacterium nodulans]